MSEKREMFCKECGRFNYDAESAAETTGFAFRGLHQLLTLETGTVEDPNGAIAILLSLMCAPLDNFHHNSEDRKGGSK